MIKSLILCFLGMVLLLIGCDSPAPNQEIKEMKFSIDSNLIDQRYTYADYGFSFSPPIHFVPFSQLELDIFIQDAERLQSAENPEKSKFIGVLGDSLTKGLLIVSEILTKDSGNVKSEDYARVLISNTDTAKVTAHKFLKNGKTVHLFVTRDEVYFTYILFFESGKGRLLQLNYQIPADVNISFSGAIESSIGTLKF